jgi:hypothetical protein
MCTSSQELGGLHGEKKEEPKRRKIAALRLDGANSDWGSAL